MLEPVSLLGSPTATSTAVTSASVPLGLSASVPVSLLASSPATSVAGTFSTLPPAAAPFGTLPSAAVTSSLAALSNAAPYTPVPSTAVPSSALPFTAVPSAVLPPSTLSSALAPPTLPEGWPPPQESEPTLAERPLEFLCEHYKTGPSAWQPLVWDESRRCFSFHAQNALSPDVTKIFYDRIRESTPWKSLMDKAKSKVSRRTAWYTRSSSCNCIYTYGEDARIEAPVDESFRKVMEDLITEVFSKFPTLPEEAWPNCANINIYDGGEQGVGWHADDELIFMGTTRDCPIVSLSLGGTREFWIALKTNENPDVKKGVVEVDLKDGDLLTLEGLIQKHCMHTVPRASRLDMRRQDPRINVTFRWMRLHKQLCPYAQVAETWYKLANAFAEAEQATEQVPPPSKASQRRSKPTKYDRGGLQILDPTDPEKANKSSASKPFKNWQRSVAMSPLPLSARALFGESSRQFSQGPPRPNNSQLYLMGWATKNGSMGAIKWQACDACGHTCYGGGRPCQEDPYSGQWYCRCCWIGWQEEEMMHIAQQAVQAAAAAQQASVYQYGDWNYFNQHATTGFVPDPGFMYNNWIG
mmetsp:Transcript_14096/g.24805  ORF Transcript_14096/g.24805 Transcript_14096/m.24805 type:complete len:583 (-) Transcript_14096:94-1842(-)